MDKDLAWSEESRTTLLQTNVLTVLQTQSISPDGKKGKYIVLDAYDWVVVVPVINENFLMVKQYRHGSKKISIEFPGGALAKDELPETGARRELLEETGFVADKLTHLGTFSPNPAIMANKIHIFAAENLTKEAEQNLDSDEYIEVIEFPQSDIFKISSDEHSHIFMITAALLYEKSKNKGEQK